MCTTWRRPRRCVSIVKMERGARKWPPLGADCVRFLGRRRRRLLACWPMSLDATCAPPPRVLLPRRHDFKKNGAGKGNWGSLHDDVMCVGVAVWYPGSEHPGACEAAHCP